jgi:hypothetical protein
MSFRNEIVTSGQRVERPKLGIGGPFSHEGVIVNTNKGNSYLIHNTPGSGVTTTPSSNMSNNWSPINDINVNGQKTVGDAMNGGYNRGTGRLGKIGEYLGSGTCKGTAKGVENALRK